MIRELALITTKGGTVAYAFSIFSMVFMAFWAIALVIFHRLSNARQYVFLPISEPSAPSFYPANRGLPLLRMKGLNPQF